MRIRVLLFAGLREAIGEKQSLMDLPDGGTLKDLVAQLERDHPVIAQYRGRLVVSRNGERAELTLPLEDGDEIALLPPMSGGSARAWVQAEPLSMDLLMQEVVGPDTGGIATFIGVVRNHSRGSAIDHLEYEAYVPMAEAEMRKIADAAAARWPGVRIAMSHRVGRLEIGDAAVMIAAVAPHRGDAFDACRFAIDTLKQTVPIWKKEFAEDGAYWVEENP